MNDTYIGKYFLFTPQEMIEYDALEAQPEEAKIDYTIPQLLEIFPEAKAVVKKNLITQIKRYRQDLIKAEEVRIDYNNRILNRIAPEHRWFYVALRDILFIEPLTDNREKLIKRNYFLLSALKPTAKEVSNKITESDIARAKTIPIENYYLGHLHKQGNTYVGKCPFHNERSGSFTIYSKENRWWCFGCQAGGDVIDFVQKRNNCNFLEAVKLILNK